jgi:hypothetical protein
MKSKTDNRGQRRGQFYWLEKKPYVSVTNVLKVIDKPALRYWFGKEVFLAMSKDPTLSQSEALSAPYRTSDKAKARGTTVHSIVEAYKVKQTVIDKTIEDYQGYADAFHKWVSDNTMEILENEKTVISKTHGFAGTLDLTARKNGDLWIIDAKTGKDIYLEAHLQLSAYKHALIEDYGVEVDRMGIVLLREDGTYKFEEATDNFEIFLAAKKIWYFLNKEECGKVGYEEK